MNYLKEFYSKSEHNYNDLFNIDYENNEKVKDIKSIISKLRKELEDKTIELNNELGNMYKQKFIPIEENVYLTYNGKNDNYTYDMNSGLCVTDTNNGTFYSLNTKVGEVNIIVGYNYELASVIVNRYKYAISTDNSKISLKIINEYVVPFFEDTIEVLDIVTKEQKNVGYYYGLNSVLERKELINFINKLYGVEYKGRLSYYDLRNHEKHNKSFEIILKTAPTEIIDDLLKLNIEESKPIHKILNMEQDIYNKALEKGVLKEFIACKKTISGISSINKTDNEWLAYMEELKSFEEDLSFYNITYSRYSYGEKSLFNLILKEYTETSYRREKNIFQDYYSLGKFTNYVLNETINQGYTSVENFITELHDYLTMCEEDNIKPTLYSSYLKQTHDITSRNHKIKVEKESEEIFKDRYKDFKTWKGEKYMVVAPTCSNDLQKEGDTLNHCVASYIKRVIDGTCLIYFLRLEEKTSLITFEVRNNTIVQVKGLHNRKPNESEVKALRDFVKAREMEINF